MRPRLALRGNVGKLALKSAGAMWPANLLVITRNASDRRRLEPWSDSVSRSGDPAATVRSALEQALHWLTVAQDRVGTGGVGSYEFYGWTQGYPEVTGYIIPSIWDCRAALGRGKLAERALRMADWELRIQKQDGGWEGGVEGQNQPPIVFNTGQVVRGLLRTHQETGDGRYLEAAVRAGDWIVKHQEPDGSWTRANHMQIKRVYDSYVSAPLARLAQVTGVEAYERAAIRNCEFVLRQQRENGWFDNCDNSPYFNDQPITHTLGYTIDGLLETGALLGREDFVAAGRKAADALMRRVSPSGLLLGRFDDAWRPRVSWACLTGCAQIGIIMMKLYTDSGEERYVDTARRLTDFLIYVQQLNAVGHCRSGALPGSYPIWGPYAPFKYPCWATKYLVDLLLLVEPTVVAKPVRAEHAAMSASPLQSVHRGRPRAGRRGNMPTRIRAKLYHLLRRTTSQDRRNRLKRRVAHARKRLAPLYRACYGTFGAEELRDELARRLPPDAEIVMVHCSLNDLQPMYIGGARELLDALIELCGPERTLAMPAFFFGGAEGDPAAYYQARPVFDVRRQPSEMGLLSELFRRRQNVRRSLHPAASVCAFGPLAEGLVAGHHLARTTFGEGTPFAIMAERRTAIVGIGTEYFRCLSQVHAAEDLLGERYPLVMRPRTMPVQLKDVDGSVHDYELRLGDTAMQRHAELLELLLGPDELIRWRFHGVPLFITSAGRVTEVLTQAALRGETIYEGMPIGATPASGSNGGGRTPVPPR